jgi:hypothetical protein
MPMPRTLFVPTSFEHFAEVTSSSAGASGRLWRCPMSEICRRNSDITDKERVHGVLVCSGFACRGRCCANEDIEVPCSSRPYNTKRQFTFGPRERLYVEEVMTAAIGAADQGVMKWSGRHRRLLSCRSAWKSTCTPARHTSSFDSIRGIEHGVSRVVSGLLEQAVKTLALNAASGAASGTFSRMCPNSLLAPRSSAERAGQ